jgi:F-type H+-transporting ATPase subunit b
MWAAFLHGLITMANEHSTGTQVPDAGHGDVFPPFDAHNFAPQLIWLALTFGALYLLMSKIALPRMAGILEARKDKIAAELHHASQLQTDATHASRSYEQVLSDSKSRAQSLTQDTHSKLSAETDAKRRALESELAAKLAAAEKQIAAIRTQAMENVDSIARDTASAIVSKLSGHAPDANSIAEAVNIARQG